MKKKLTVLIIALFAISFAFTSCRYEITENKGVVQSVVKIKDTDSEKYGKTYVVKVKIEDDDITYHLYTDQIYTVGDVIQFKK